MPSLLETFRTIDENNNNHVPSFTPEPDDDDFPIHGFFYFFYYGKKTTKYDCTRKWSLLAIKRTRYVGYFESRAILMDKNCKELVNCQYEGFIWALRHGLNENNNVKFYEWPDEENEVKLCDILFNLLGINTALNKKFNIRTNCVVLSVNPIPVFNGAPGLEPVFEVYITYDPKEVFNLKRGKKQYGQVNFPQLFFDAYMTFRELRYQLLFGQKIMPLFSYDWVNKHRKDYVTRQEAIDMFKEDNVYADVNEREWTEEHECIYNTIMSKLNVCRCIELTPTTPLHEWNFFIKEEYNDSVRKMKCNQKWHVCNDDKQCREYRDCYGVRNVYYNE